MTTYMYIHIYVYRYIFDMFFRIQFSFSYRQAINFYVLIFLWIKTATIRFHFSKRPLEIRWDPCDPSLVSLEGISPALYIYIYIYIYRADLISVVFFLLSLFSKWNIYFFILVFSDPFLFSLFLFLCSTFSLLPVFYHIFLTVLFIFLRIFFFIIIIFILPFFFCIFFFCSSYVLPFIFLSVFLFFLFLSFFHSL